MTRFGVPGQNVDTLSYADDRLATVPSIQAPRRPTVTDKKFPLWCEWRVNKEASLPAEEGEFWKLVRYESNGDATWVMFGGGGGTGPLINIETDDGTPNVVPDGVGEIQILGGAGISVTGQGPGKTITVALSGGGTAVDQVNVDFNTAPGTDPVLPTAAGEIQVYGNTVTNATNANSPVATHSRAANQFHIDVQLAAAVAPSPADPYDVGLCSFDNTMFTVDANGFVQLAGGGIAIDTLTGDDGGAVTPDGSGNFDLIGSVVANATNAKPLYFDGTETANTQTLELQVSTTLSADAADTNDAGIASFSSQEHDITANGLVTWTDRVRLVEGHTENLELSYSSPTLTIRGANGSDLSSSNPGIVVIRNSSEDLQVFTLTSNFTFQDASGTGDVTGNEFGVLDAAVSTGNVPFFLYFVLDDNDANPVPLISRFPNLKDSPPTTAIGTPSSAIADSSGDFWSFSNITVGDYNGNPISLVGSLRMTQTGTFDWTVTSLSGGDGIGRYQDNREFIWRPVFQGFTTAGSFTYSARTGAYRISKEGQVWWRFDATTSGSSGSPAGLMSCLGPFVSGSNTGGNIYGPFWGSSATTAPAGTKQVTVEFGTATNVALFRTVDWNVANSYLSVDTSAAYNGTIDYTADPIYS